MSKRLKTIGLLTILMLLWIYSGCSNSNDDDAQKAVQQYNQSLTAVLRTGSVELLNSTATENEVRRMELFLNYLNEKRQVLLATLENIRFKSVGSPASDKVYVKTDEIWRYEYLKAGTSERVEGPYQIKYDTTYTLIKSKDKWVVDEVYFQETKL